MKTIFGFLTRSFGILIIANLVCLLFRMADGQEYQPVFNPSIMIAGIDGKIDIDGKLDDSGWKNAVNIGNFVERYPGVNLMPNVKTEVLLTYDEHNLYVAFKCQDDPAKLRATMCQRDQFNGDDAVSVLLDTYGNAAWAYEFFVNPYGVQKDYLWTSVQGEDYGYDIIWESAADITDWGYQVEIAIPFASIRFPNKDAQTWKIDFWRNHPRDSYRQYSWAAYNQNDQCWVCQWGTVEGIKNVKSGKGLEILPSLIWSQNGGVASYSNPDSLFNEGRGKAEASLGAKYSLSSDVTIEATYNPDFSQIEADAAQIDVNTTISLLYPERRPFFQEGSDIFRTFFNSFYTRTVSDPIFAAKLTGRTSRYSLGMLSAYDENTPYVIPLEEYGPVVSLGKSAVNVVRGTRTIGTNNMLGVIVTDRRFDAGGYGTVVGVDGDIRLSSKYSIIGQVIYSFTEEPDDSVSSAENYLEGVMFDDSSHSAALDGETYAGGAIITQFRRRTRNWNFTLDYNHVSPTYRTETGYYPWNDYRIFSVYSNYNFYPAGSIIERLAPQIYAQGRWNFDGESKWRQANVSLEGNLRIFQMYWGFGYENGEERWWGLKFYNLWNFEGYAGAQLGNKLGIESNFHYGRSVARWIPAKSKELFFMTAMEIKPIDRLIIEPSLSYISGKDVETDAEFFKQTILRTRLRLQINKEFSVRLVTQYNDGSDRWDIDPLVTYKINPFSIFYIGSSHDILKLDNVADQRREWHQTHRQFFMKLQYLFRV